MTRLWCSIYDGDPADFSGPTPGPMGVNDASDPAVAGRGGGRPGSTPGSLGVSDAACALAEGPLALPESESSCSEMTPYEFMQRYRQLDVPYVSRDTGHVCHVEADVHVYVNDGLSNRRSNEDEKTQIQGLVRQSARQAARGQSAVIATDRGAHNLAIAHAYYGKGAPWEFRIYLAYALTYGRATPGALADYCDRNARLGIDCSGFVNSFLVATGRVSRARDIDSYARNAARGGYGDLRPLDLLIWQRSDGDASRHIAIIDHLVGSNQMQVVESSGSKGGLTASIYTVQSAENGVFTVDRGLDEDGNAYPRPSSVKIVAYQ